MWALVGVVMGPFQSLRTEVGVIVKVSISFRVALVAYMPFLAGDFMLAGVVKIKKCLKPALAFVVDFMWAVVADWFALFRRMVSSKEEVGQAEECWLGELWLRASWKNRESKTDAWFDDMVWSWSVFFFGCLKDLDRISIRGWRPHEICALSVDICANIYVELVASYVTYTEGFWFYSWTWVEWHPLQIRQYGAILTVSLVMTLLRRFLEKRYCRALAAVEL